MSPLLQLEWRPALAQQAGTGRYSARTASIDDAICRGPRGTPVFRGPDHCSVTSRDADVGATRTLHARPLRRVTTLAPLAHPCVGAARRPHVFLPITGTLP